MLISVIIPIYNIERYIERCVNSVVCQDFSDCEIIMVNDGSTDTSQETADEIAGQHERISVIHQQNGGLSDARNTGINNAKGEYLLFLDGDDELEENSLSGIAALLNKNRPQVLIGQFAAIDEKTGDVIFSRDTELKAENINGCSPDAVAGEMKRVNASPCAWRYVVKRDFLMENGLYFQKGLLCEDAYWTPRLLTKAESFWLNEQVFYRYYIRDGSIMTSFNFKRITDVLLIAKDNHQYSKTLSKTQSEYINNLNYLIVGNSLTEYGLFDRQQKAFVRKWARENKKALIDSMGKYKVPLVFGLLFGGINAHLLTAFIIKTKRKAMDFINRRKNGAD